MLGDASTRAYERLTKPDGTTAVLMISPPRRRRAAGPVSASPIANSPISPKMSCPFVAIGHSASRPWIFSPRNVLAEDIEGGFVVA